MEVTAPSSGLPPATRPTLALALAVMAMHVGTKPFGMEALCLSNRLNVINGPTAGGKDRLWHPVLPQRKMGA